MEDMGHKTLTEKLDQIGKEDLGIHFDQSLLWNELEAQLDQKKKPVLSLKLLMAACIALLILFLPFTLLDHMISVNDNPVQNQRVETVIPKSENDSEQPIIEPVKKQTAQRKITVPTKTDSATFNEELAVVEQISEPEKETEEIESTPVKMEKEEQPKRRVFALQDISVIQASLEKPAIERERGFAIKAQLQSDSRPSDLFKNKELKFTLYAKQE